jgi:hypothetical protein
MPAVCLHGVSGKTETRNKMNTYYTKHSVNDIYTPATISSEDAIAILIQSAVTNAVNKVNDIIINAVIARVNDAVSDSNIQSRVATHLSAMNITDVVDEAVKDAVAEYDYDGVIDNALDGVDIDEMVTEMITDHLGDSNIKISIN